MWCLEAVPRLEAASRQIFTALVLVLVLDFSALALALALVLRVGALALALSQDRDQDTNLQGKTQHSTQSTRVGALIGPITASSATNECCDWLMPNCMSSRELGTVDLLWLLIAYMN